MQVSNPAQLLPSVILVSHPIAAAFGCSFSSGKPVRRQLLLIHHSYNWWVYLSFAYESVCAYVIVRMEVCMYVGVLADLRV